MGMLGGQKYLCWMCHLDKHCWVFLLPAVAVLVICCSRCPSVTLNPAPSSTTTTTKKKTKRKSGAFAARGLCHYHTATAGPQMNSRTPTSSPPTPHTPSQFASHPAESPLLLLARDSQYWTRPTPAAFVIQSSAFVIIHFNSFYFSFKQIISVMLRCLPDNPFGVRTKKQNKTLK